MLKISYIDFENKIFQTNKSLIFDFFQTYNLIN